MNRQTGDTYAMLVFVFCPQCFREQAYFAPHLTVMVRCRRPFKNV
jgi:hypothetical protein